MMNKKNYRNYKISQTDPFPCYLQVLLLLILIVAGVGIYADTMHAPFVFDDHNFILNDYTNRITQLTPETLFRAAIDGRAARRLIPNASFALNYYFGRYAPAGYHLLNIVIHLLAAVFLYFFTKHTITVSGPYRHPLPAKQKPYTLSAAPELIAFFAALLWMGHPVQTQAVTYICQRMTSLVALFYILSLLLYVKGRMAMQAENTGQVKIIVYFAGCLVAGICAVASKQNAGTLPLIILVYEWFFFQNLKLFNSKKSLLLAAAVVAIFAAIAITYLGDAPIKRILAGYAHRDFTPSQRVMTEWRVILYYVSLLFWPAPSRLNLDHDYPLSFSLVTPGTTLLSLIAIAGLIFTALALARKDRLFSFIIIWFLGTLAIESSIIGIEIIFEHRNYLPSMLVAVGVVVMIFRLFRDKRLACGCLCLLAASCAFWTYQRNTVWENRVSLWQDCAQKSPGKSRPHNDLGVALYDTDDPYGAITEYEKALHIDPNRANILNNMGNALLKLGRTDDAIGFFKRSLQISPEYIKGENNLGNAFMIKGNYQKAAEHFKSVLDKKPDNVEANINMGAALARLNKIDDATVYYKKALTHDPYNPEAHNNLGVLFVQKRMYQQAFDHFNQALVLRPGYDSAKNNIQKLQSLEEQNQRQEDNLKDKIALEPKNALLHFKLAKIYEANGKLNDAVEAYKTAIELDPKYTSAIYNLALLYAASGDNPKAIQSFRQLIVYQPDNALVYYNIACLYARQKKKEDAVLWLKQAIDHGYNNWDHLKTDVDLHSIRETDFYKRLMQLDEEK